jgi:hypothetical protein
MIPVTLHDPATSSGCGRVSRRNHLVCLQFREMHPHGRQLLLRRRQRIRHHERERLSGPRGDCRPQEVQQTSTFSDCLDPSIPSAPVQQLRR